MHKKLQLSALAVAASVFAIACSDPAGPTRTLSGDVAAAVNPHPIDFQGGGTYPPNSGLSDGVVRLCKTANATGTFAFTYSVDGAQAQPIPGGGSLMVTTPGTPACVNIHVSSVDNNATPGYETVVITEAADQTNWALTDRTIDQYFGAFVTYPAPRLDDDDDAPDARSVTVYINNDMAKLATFTNTFTTPEEPPPICDFITFGRLVVETPGGKVVISGNAGGNKPGGGILGEFHIEANGVDNHVADIATYGPIAAGPLSAFTNSRIVTGTAKNGVAVELRLWDGGEPGKGTDRVYVKLNGVELLGASGKLIDQGNMQYHPECRGPEN